MIAGRKKPNGYVQIEIEGKAYYAHRLVWKVHHGTDPTSLIDHINGDRNDNRIENLREATASESTQSRCTPRSNTSGVKGVYWAKQRGAWGVKITIGGVQHFLGYFDDKSEAAEVANTARSKFHGEFARV
jgi:hypothetical protein